MKDIKHHNSSNHHRPVKRNKVPLRGNQIPRPALRKLNSPINTPHINTQNRKDHRPKQRHDRPLHIPKQILAQRAPHKICRAQHENRDREQLEDDTRDHGPGPRSRVAVYLVGFGGGETAADGLDDERDYVAGAENPEVETWGENGGLTAEDFDEAAEEDVDAGCEEGGCYSWSVLLCYSLICIGDGF